MSGTADDEQYGAAGLASVQILLKLQDAQAYWNGGNSGTSGDWDTLAGTKYNQWRTAGGLSNWSLAFPLTGPMESRTLRLWVRAADLAGNASATPSNGQLDADLNGDGSAAYSFTYDNTAPTSRVAYPSAATNFTPVSVSGTAEDANPTYNPSGVVSVKLRAMRSDGAYWNLVTPGWTGGNLFDSWSITGLTSWSFPFVGAFEEGYRYDINTTAQDAANNWENAYATFTFVVDLTTPASTVLWPSNDSYVSSAAVQIRGTADDLFCSFHPVQCNASRKYESGIQPSSVTVAVAEIVVSTNWWDGSAFASGTPVWSTAVFVGGTLAALSLESLR